MIPLVDVHCHLLAGLDDGPRTLEEAVAMCRRAWAEGTRAIAATAHMNEQWPGVTPDRIRAATRRLALRLDQIGLPLTVFPAAEVMVRPHLEASWERGELMSMADRGAYLLIELPTGAYVDLRPVVCRLSESGIRPILAHPERRPELLYDVGLIEELIRLGCLVQVSSDSITGPRGREESHALKRWVRRGVVHLIGSDGHSPESRPPGIAQAYRRIAAWAGVRVADRICSVHGLAVFQGLPLRPPQPRPPARWRWPFRLGKRFDSHLHPIGQNTRKTRGDASSML
jgi:protein-tyrosine phosphatase